MDNILKLKQLVERAESLIGKKVRNGNSGADLVVGDFCIILTQKQADERSLSVIEEFQKNGFCIALRDVGAYSSIPLLDNTELFQEDIIIKLTDEYDAIISKNEVKVGCQTIPKEKIVEIYKIITEFK